MRVLRSFYIEPELDQMLAHRAEDEGCTRSELIRRFILEGLGVAPFERERDLYDLGGEG